MKKLRQVITIVLSLMLLLCGCNTNGNSDETETTTQKTGSQFEENINCQYLPATVENPDNLPVLKWVCLTERFYGGGLRTWNEAAVQELNQMLADKNMPFRVQFVLLTSDAGYYTSDWFSKPEVTAVLKDADLLYAQMTAEQMCQYLAPITEYVTGTATPSLKNAVPHKKNWLASTVNGQIYGIDTVPAQACSNGWIVKASLLTKYGLTEADFSRNFWEMDDVFAKIYNENGNNAFLFVRLDGFTQSSDPLLCNRPSSYYPGVVFDMISYTYSTVGSCYGIDYSAGSPVVVNQLDTDTVRNMQKAIARYQEAGYITVNQTSAQLSYGKVVGGEVYTDGSGNILVPVTPALFKATNPKGEMSGISATAQHKKEAVSLLNLIAEDEAFRMQMFYGKEGRDYTVTGGYYNITTQEDGSNYSLDFLSPLSYFCGLTSDPMKANFRSPGTENWRFIAYEGKSVLQTYCDSLSDSTSTYPYIFDYTGVEQKLTAMVPVFEKYFSKFSRMTDAEYDQMLQELDAAGSGEVLAALQQQLKQWQSE